MKENNNILIITRNSYYQEEIFRDIASVMKDGICTYYNYFDIKNRSKHIKITDINNLAKFRNNIEIIEDYANKPDIIILDSYLHTNEFDKLFDYCHSITDNIIYIDFNDISNSFFIQRAKGQSPHILD